MPKRMTPEDKYYQDCMDELLSLIPQEEKEIVFSQTMCEYDREFLGFIDEYKPLSEAVPKDKIIIDFGCYLAAQAYFFGEHRKYIGVDVETMRRFTPPNAEHHVCSIQQFIKTHTEALFKQYGSDACFAICSFVPDFKATDLVKNTFQNGYVVYPGRERTLWLNTK